MQILCDFLYNSLLLRHSVRRDDYMSEGMHL